MKTEAFECYSLCERCYEFPRQKTNGLCRRCAALHRAAEDMHRRAELSGDGGHLQRLRASGRDYGP